MVVLPDLRNPSYILQLPFNSPRLEKVSPVLRALSPKGVVDIEYASRNSGISSRTIIPHTFSRLLQSISIKITQ